MSVAVDQSLQDAIGDFEAALTQQQKQHFHTIKAVPDAGAVIAFTAQLDEEKAKKGTCGVSSRLYTFLQSIQRFTTIVDTLVSSHPQIAALVWGSVKYTMLVASNFTSYFDRLSTLFMSFNKLCPRFDEYQALFPESCRLKKALCDFHASIIRCCKQALALVERKWQTHLRNALWKSFQTEFEPHEKEIRRCSKEVDHEILLASAQAAHQDRQLLLYEQKAASNHRSTAKTFFRGAHRDNEDARNWRLRVEERKSRKRRQQLLDSLSVYNYHTAFKQARKKRHANTAQWLTRTSAFTRWLDGTSEVLWCSGKLGSGKTVVAANIVDYLFLHQRSGSVCVAFFFCRFDEAQSLEAETILRSITRQSFDGDVFPPNVQEYLEKISHNGSALLDDLKTLLRIRSTMFQTYYVIIDALNECEKRERDVILVVLRSVIESCSSSVKILFTSPPSMDREIEKWFPSRQVVSMGCTEAQSDIIAYVEETIDQRLENEDLVVGTAELARHIQESLINGAQGMFLWVNFQIEDICSQCSDEDIRQALQHLPKNLTETFNRALTQVCANGTGKIAKQVFRWVAAAKRPLSVEELGEAIAVEPGQQYSKPERLMNGARRIPAWCQNLVLLDEEDEVVQFAHHAVKDFFLSGAADSRADEFRIDVLDADHDIGEICVTYLDFNDFKTQLIQRPTPQPRLIPVAIAQSALAHGPKLVKAAASFSSVAIRTSQKITQHDTTKELAKYSQYHDADPEDTLTHSSHPFLAYARGHWLLHTTAFKGGKSKMWRVWARMLFDEQSLGHTPWTHDQFVDLDPIVVDWVCREHHAALLSVMGQSERILSQGERWRIIDKILKRGDPTLLEALYQTKSIFLFRDSAALVQTARTGHLGSVQRLLTVTKEFMDDPAVLHEDHVWTAMQTALQAAAAQGHFSITKVLLDRGADVNVPAAGINGRTALQAAAGAGSFDVVRVLLDRGADVNAPAGIKGRTALQAAAGAGSFDVVEVLLDRGADVNAPAVGIDGRTALQAAAAQGHFNITEVLYHRGADVNVPAAGINGRTALQTAAGGGHLELVEMLLDGGADVNAPATMQNGRTALQAAAAAGYSRIVAVLLDRGADVNAPAAVNAGRTALQAAAGGGHLDLVKMLLDGGADINAPATRQNGRTALQAAAAGGHPGIVIMLLDRGADVNAPAAVNAGRTALQAAAERGHLVILVALLTQGAHVNAPAAAHSGRTALYGAVAHGHADVVERLLDVGADIHATAGSTPQTLVQVAVSRGHLDVLEKLIRAAADIELDDICRPIILKMAAESGNSYLVEKLSPHESEQFSTLKSQLHAAFGLPALRDVETNGPSRSTLGGFKSRSKGS